LLKLKQLQEKEKLLESALMTMPLSNKLPVEIHTLQQIE